MGIRSRALLIALLAWAALIHGCKPKQGQSGVLAFTLDTGKQFIAPKSRDQWSFRLTSGARQLTAEDVAKKAGIRLEAREGRQYLTSISAVGESVLFVENRPNPPKPLFSVDSVGQVFAWSFLGVRDGAVTVNLNMFVRHPRQAPAKIEYDAYGNGKNLYFLHLPLTSDGTGEPVLVPDTMHFVVGKASYYRLGNSIFDAKTQRGILGFQEYGSRVWSYVGPEMHRDVPAGTVFWSPDLATYFSIAPGAVQAVRWTAKGGEVLDVAGTLAIADARPPATALNWMKLNAKAKAAAPAGGATAPIVYAIESPDRGTIIARQYGGALLERTGLNLAGEHPFTADVDYLPPGLRLSTMPPDGLALQGGAPRSGRVVLTEEQKAQYEKVNGRPITQEEFDRYQDEANAQQQALAAKQQAAKAELKDFNSSNQYPPGHHVRVDTPAGPKIGITGAPFSGPGGVTNRVYLFDEDPSKIQLGADGMPDPSKHQVARVLEATKGYPLSTKIEPIEKVQAANIAAIEREREELPKLAAEAKEQSEAWRNGSLATANESFGKVDEFKEKLGSVRGWGELTIESAKDYAVDKVKEGLINNVADVNGTQVFDKKGNALVGELALDAQNFGEIVDKTAGGNPEGLGEGAGAVVGKIVAVPVLDKFAEKSVGTLTTALVAGHQAVNDYKDNVAPAWDAVVATRSQALSAKGDSIALGAYTNGGSPGAVTEPSVTSDPNATAPVAPVEDSAADPDLDEFGSAMDGYELDEEG